MVGGREEEADPRAVGGCVDRQWQGDILHEAGTGRSSEDLKRREEEQSYGAGGVRRDLRHWRREVRRDGRAHPRRQPHLLQVLPHPPSAVRARRGARAGFGAFDARARAQAAHWQWHAAPPQASSAQLRSAPVRRASARCFAPGMRSACAPLTFSERAQWKHSRSLERVRVRSPLSRQHSLCANDLVVDAGSKLLDRHSVPSASAERVLSRLAGDAEPAQQVWDTLESGGTNYSVTVEAENFNIAIVCLPSCTGEEENCPAILRRPDHSVSVFGGSTKCQTLKSSIACLPTPPIFGQLLLMRRQTFRF